MKNLTLNNNFLDHFRGIAPYINVHRKKTFLILLEETDILDKIIEDITLLLSLDIHIILIYDIDTVIKKYNKSKILKKSDLNFLLNIVGKKRIEIEASFSKGLINSPMFNSFIEIVSGNLVFAKPIGIQNGIDFELQGEFRGIKEKQIQGILEQNKIILIPPIGYSITGEIFNLAHKELSENIASILKVDKLIFLINDFIDKKDIPRELSPQQALSISSNQNEGKLYECLELARKATLNGVNRVHILPVNHDGALIQELFTRDGTGIMVTNNHYEDIRQAKTSDIGGLIALLKPLEEQGTLVHRNKETLENDIDNFFVIEREGAILACAALYPIIAKNHEIKFAEIACVVVNPEYRKSNRATQILNFLQKKAKQQGIEKIFILTTHTEHWFIEQGFEKKTIKDLPNEKQQAYNYQRNSKILIKSL